MLDPRGRQLLLASLRPPVGYHFDCAIGTTYSLDLLALLTTPLAFTLFDWQGEDGRLAADPRSPTADPLALLESLRRCADRIHLFCQAGQIKVPPAHQRLLAFLEQSVIEVQPPAALRGGPGVFHPKLWVIRYTSSSEPIKYRLVCLSRNLTFDRSWDTVLILEGDLIERERGFRRNRELSEFLASFPGMALRPESMRDETRNAVERLSREIGRVKWELPEGIDKIQFWPIGHGANTQWPFSGRTDRFLVIAPFMTEEFLERFDLKHDAQFLVSRLETLRALDPTTLAGKWQCFCLEDGVDATSEEANENAEPTASTEVLSGLHAKVFIADAGWDAHVWTGSANATTAAFNGNVEFLVEMIGKKSKVGIDATIAEDSDIPNLRPLLIPFEPGADGIQRDSDAQEAEQAAETVRRTLMSLECVIRIDEAAGGFITRIESARGMALGSQAIVRCRPIMLPGADEKELAGRGPIRLTFGPHALESISSFVAFEVIVRVREAEARIRFVLNLPMIGAPSNRTDRLLHDLLKDSRTLMRFLLLLLSEDPDRLFEEMRDVLSQPDGTPGRDTMDLLPVLEHLLRALDRRPDKLEHVRRLIEDLQRTPEGRSIIPPALESAWEPIRSVLDEMLATTVTPHD